MFESPLAPLEPRLRTLLPAMLYAEAWSNPTPAVLAQVFDHLRTLRYILQDYVPRYDAESRVGAGKPRNGWQEGALLFTDLAGFTTLVEAHSTHGAAGAAALLAILNNYFAAMVEVISKSGGNLLEWTGDALLVQFRADTVALAAEQAVRTGLRMQRAMQRFQAVASPEGEISLGMRIGIHTGRYVAADIGTPRRMEYVLLGEMVQATKEAEGAGVVGRVALSPAAYSALGEAYRAEQGNEDHWLIIDDLTDQDLGEYDIAPVRRRQLGGVLFDRSVAGIIEAIEGSLPPVEQLASYLPSPVLNLLVESAARRRVPAQFLELPVVFVNLTGLTNAIDHVDGEDAAAVLRALSRCFSLIDAAVQARGGVLKNMTYDKVGSTIMIYFGAVNGHLDDPVRAAQAALAIRDLIANFEPLEFDGAQVRVEGRIGLAYGPAFAAEIGEPRGRREFNLLGDVVNTAARLMAYGKGAEILINEALAERIASHCACTPLGPVALKGKAAALSIYSLDHEL